ncbi:MAG: hypothetical protein H7267_01800 [Sandarakinorhabdus sp.]|nr:hypothetical protein [Sandarakinorhabdus sp.]
MTRAYHILVVLAVASASAGRMARAGEFAPVSMAAYQAAAAANRPIIFHVRADRCPVSRAQDKILAALMQQPAYKNTLVLDVDFDKNKPALAMLRAERQGTIIVRPAPETAGGLQTAAAGSPKPCRNTGSAHRPCAPAPVADRRP